MRVHEQGSNIPCAPGTTLLPHSCSPNCIFQKATASSDAYSSTRTGASCAKSTLASIAPSPRWGGCLCAARSRTSTATALQRGLHTRAAQGVACAVFCGERRMGCWRGGGAECQQSGGVSGLG
jgi:hypothetical protein